MLFATTEKKAIALNDILPFLRSLTLSTWLHAPTRPLVVNHARLVAAARVIVEINTPALSIPVKERPAAIKATASKEFHPLSVANALVFLPLGRSFIDLFQGDRAFNVVSAIAAFILRYPSEEKKRPSLNKAVFFISKGGFGKTENAKGFIRSPAPLKKAWATSAIVSSFALAAHRLDFHDIVNLAPDDDPTIDDATELLNNISQLRRYFGGARAFQEALLARIELPNRRDFVEFSDRVKSYSVSHPPFSSDQLELIKKYHV
jgi:hypothetical protein